MSFEEETNMISEKKMIHVASYLLVAAALIILIKKSRNPRERAVIVAMFKDRNAMAFDGVDHSIGMICPTYFGQ